MKFISVTLNIMKCYRLLIVVSFLLFSMTSFADEQTLVNDFRELTSECNTKTIKSWLTELDQFETKLYELSYGMDRDAFHQAFLSHTDKNTNDTLYWLYELYGHAYTPSRGGPSCWGYFYEFKKALSESDTQAVVGSMSIWKSCVWDMERKPQPLADVFEACHSVIRR